MQNTMLNFHLMNTCLKKSLLGDYPILVKNELLNSLKIIFYKGEATEHGEQVSIRSFSVQKVLKKDQIYEIDIKFLIE